MAIGCDELHYVSVKESKFLFLILFFLKFCHCQGWTEIKRNLTDVLKTIVLRPTELV